MTINISKDYADRLDKALQEWRAGTTRERIRSILLDLLRIQRESPVRGRKLAAGEDVVLVPSSLLRELFTESATRTKFRRWVVSSNLVKMDGSWVSKSISRDSRQAPRCNGWHITEPDCAIVRPGTVSVEFDPTLAIYGRYRDAIINAEGHEVAGETFRGRWALDAYDHGTGDWATLREVARIATAVLGQQSKSKPEKVSCRDFTIVALTRKSLRPKCFTSPDGTGMEEIFDIRAAILTTTRFGASLLAPDKYGCDGGLPYWGDNLAKDTRKDPYKAIYDAVLTLDPKTAVFSRAKWCKSVRKIVKMDVQVVCNCDSAYLARCEQAYIAYRQGAKVPINLRRQWLIWQAMRRTNERLWRVALRCKRSGFKDACYRVTTLGEKMIMSAIVDWCARSGYRLHRVHDALWTTDKRLLALDKSAFARIVGEHLAAAFRAWGYRHFRKYVSDEEVAWAWEALTLTPEEERRMGGQLMGSYWTPAKTDRFCKNKKGKKSA